MYFMFFSTSVNQAQRLPTPHLLAGMLRSVRTILPVDFVYLLFYNLSCFSIYFLIYRKK